MKLTHTVSVLALIALVSACGPREEILPGERLDLRALDAGAPPDATGEAAEAPAAAPGEVVNRALPIALPGAVANAEWTHRNGAPGHRITHPALGPQPKLIWSAGIGEGDNRKHRITADPVVAGGRVFTLDSRAGVTATSTGGGTLWRRDLTPDTDGVDDASGGGLAYGNGVLFVSTSFGELVALDPATGDERWTQRFDAPVAGAPTVQDGLVYVVARDGSGWAVDAANGRVRWQIPGAPSRAGMTNGSAPAAEGQTVIFPFSSGEMVGALKQGGVKLWTAQVAGRKLGRAYGNVSDITADPVIVGDVVYAGNQSGRVAAVSTSSGERIWTAKEGAYSPVWPVGNSVFLVSDDAHLVRLDAETGETVWSVEMPYFTTTKVKKLKSVYAHYGPVLAGGRLIVASSDGLLRSFDPVSGALTGSVAVPGGATTNPVIAGGTLFVVSQKGQLLAYR